MRRELFKTRLSCYPDDLAVLTWDHAFLLEPAGDTKVADARRVLPSLARRGYANMARDLYARVAEVTEITHRAGDALRVTEDVYVARIYAAALDVFRVPVYAAAVEQKLALMRDTYGALYEEAATGRAEILEAAIVLLIVLEIVLAFVCL